jgi:hypothetical protein
MKYFMEKEKKFMKKIRKMFMKNSMEFQGIFHGIP